MEGDEVTGKWALFGAACGVAMCGAVTDFGSGRALLPALWFYVAAGIMFTVALFWAWPRKGKS